MNPFGLVCQSVVTAFWLQVDFWMDPVKDPSASNFCIPGWAVRPVARADQAYFELVSQKEKIVIHKTGDDDLDFAVS